MNDGAFKSWLEAYDRAWETGDPQAAAALFTEDATYQETPFDAPMRGRDAIVAYWSDVPLRQEDIRFGYDILATTADQGIAHWWATFVRIPSGVRVKLDGVFAVTLDADNRCRTFREWWHRQETGPTETPSGHGSA
jgi:hypothetical protein